MNIANSFLIGFSTLHKTLLEVLIIKKNLKLLMAVSTAAIVLFTACGTKTPSDAGDESTSSTESSTDSESSQVSAESTESEPKTIIPELLKSYEFTVEGTTITLPMKYSDFEALGFVPDEDDIQEECLPDSMGLLINTTKDGYPAHITAVTHGTEPVSYKDTDIIRFNSYESYASNGGNANVTLPGGLKLWESTVADALELYGRPTESTDTSIEYTFTYTIEDDFQTKPPTNCEYVLSFREDSGIFCGFSLTVKKPVN